MKATGGGLFDPQDRGIYFAAGFSQVYPKHMLIAVNDLPSGDYHKHLEGLRGVKANGASMTTSSLTGIFRMGEARNEFLTITDRR